MDGPKSEHKMIFKKLKFKKYSVKNPKKKIPNFGNLSIYKFDSELNSNTNINNILNMSTAENLDENKLNNTIKLGGNLSNSLNLGQNDYHRESKLRDSSIIGQLDNLIIKEEDSNSYQSRRNNEKTPHKIMINIKNIFNKSNFNYGKKPENDLISHSPEKKFLENKRVLLKPDTEILSKLQFSSLETIKLKQQISKLMKENSDLMAEKEYLKEENEIKNKDIIKLKNYITQLKKRDQLQINNLQGKELKEELKKYKSLLEMHDLKNKQLKEQVSLINKRDIEMNNKLSKLNSRLEIMEELVKTKDEEILKLKNSDNTKFFNQQTFGIGGVESNRTQD